MFGSMIWIDVVLALSGCTDKQTSTPRQVIEHESGAPSNPADTDVETGESASPNCMNWGAPEVAATVSDPGLDEISGIVMSRRQPGVLWVHEDSGAGPVLTALGTDGVTMATLTLTGGSSTDWEDLAIAPCGDADCLWVGDFGDNSEQRTDVQLLRVEEPLIGGRSTLEAPAVAVPYRYEEGPQDAEALVVTRTGQPYVLTKRTDATSHIYSIPMDGAGVAERVATISTGTTSGLPTSTTAADIWPDDSRMLIRGYLYSFELGRGQGRQFPAASALPPLPNPSQERGPAPGQCRWVRVTRRLASILPS